jgi:tetratricopeptide (TPR) repeat protein
MGGADALAERLLRAALATQPDLALAQIGLASALDAQDREGAEPLARRAVELGADDPTVRVYAGDLYLRRAWRATQGDSPDPVRAAELALVAREHFARARELAPELPATHAGFGATYLYTSEDALPGLEALEQARALLRWHSGIAYNLAALRLKMGERDRARRLLVQVVNGAHPSPLRDGAGQLLQELERTAPSVGQSP